ncbi:MarR family winged helix-turn-helix transcriptional regulator [Vogesella sp. LIG4]|uniref:MarR family winged helix-turn-helix transcriptional regulator n=1 Tax=Vogesella sp. LIG4 TaxID=1192162 RepID=UPI00081FC77D|nr:MarR family transcriptional regulator [Vogesella sp. LIG4]SCK21696.1 DNA-binding transcriptional regulator, MarR family [Vogesella sp. LIG4]
MTQATPLPRTRELIRELVRAYQAFEQRSNNRIRLHGLTHAQFDVIATLGNTPGMSCKTLSEKTLITKGTLTGVLDRLLEKQLITRTVDANDRRSLFVALTDEGEALFRQSFPDVAGHISSAFDHLDDGELAAASALLHRVRLALENEQET